MTTPTPTARLMLHALRAFELELARRLSHEDFGDVSVALTNVLRHLDPGGMRLGSLAADAGMTKQAVSQAVKGLVALELVRVTPDPEDKRAKRVVYTARGQALVERAIVHLRAIEAEWEAELGTRRYATLRKALQELARTAED